jgi:DNA topoisomerase-6 subunit B
MSKKVAELKTSTVAEYFSKNMGQVGFSSLTKAVITSVKEACDNSLDACEEHGILPELKIYVEKIGQGSNKNADLVKVTVEDNGPGISEAIVGKVFGQYLSSSKFGMGRCSRGQQGIGISSVSMYSQLTNASGAQVLTKRKEDKEALSVLISPDAKINDGVLKNKKYVKWANKEHGTRVEFVFDGKIQVNGDSGLLNYIIGTSLVNPHATITYRIPGIDEVTLERVTDVCPVIPEATEPHPHTHKLGEFMSHSHMYPKTKASAWLKKGYSRMSDNVLKAMVDAGLSKSILDKNTEALSEEDFKVLYKSTQDAKIMGPPTSSVLTIGEEALSKAVTRLGEVDFFSVLSRSPTVCDAKPVQIEVAIARLKGKPETDDSVQVLRFANRVPLQFDKASCATTSAITSVSWKPYGISQSKDSLPTGPYIFAISIVSPFIKFKNASKETLDASEELVEEIRRALIQCGQKLAKHIKKEEKDNALEEKLRHIEMFTPIIVEKLMTITKAPAGDREKAKVGLNKVLGRDVAVAKEELKAADAKLSAVNPSADGKNGRKKSKK